MCEKDYQVVNSLSVMMELSRVSRDKVIMAKVRVIGRARGNRGSGSNKDNMVINNNFSSQYWVNLIGWMSSSMHGYM